jgi:copper(I)-binding protein
MQQLYETNDKSEPRPHLRRPRPRRLHLRLFRLVAAAVVAALVTSACGADGNPDIPENAAADGRVGQILVRNLALLPPGPGGVYPPGSDVSAVVTLLNEGDAPDVLLGASSPLARDVQLVVDGRDVDQVVLAPGQRDPQLPPVELRLRAVREEIRTGSTVPIALRFGEGGQARFEVPVKLPYRTNSEG